MRLRVSGRARDRHHDLGHLSAPDWIPEGLRERGGRIAASLYASMARNPFPMERNYSDSVEARVEEVTAHYVRFRKVGSSTSFTEPLAVLHPSWDDQKNRPAIFVTRLPES